MTKKRETHRTRKSHRRRHITASLKSHNNEAGRGHGNVRWPTDATRAQQLRAPSQMRSIWRWMWGRRPRRRATQDGIKPMRRGGGEGRRRNTKKKQKKHRRHKKTKKHRRHKNEAGRGKEEEEEEEEDEWDEERWGPAPWDWWNQKRDEARQKRENAQNEIVLLLKKLREARKLAEFDAIAKKIKDLNEMLETVLLPREKRAKDDLEEHEVREGEW